CAPSGAKGRTMALFEDLTIGSVTSTLLLGVGVVVAAPLWLPVVGAVVRPVVRLAVQGGVLAYDATAGLVTTVGTELDKIVADVRAQTTSTLVPDPIADIIRPEGTSA